jgi:hypothetical protein
LTFAQKKAHFRESYSDTSRGFSAGSQSQRGGEKITHRDEGSGRTFFRAPMMIWTRPDRDREASSTPFASPFIEGREKAER